MHFEAYEDESGQKLYTRVIGKKLRREEPVRVYVRFKLLDDDGNLVGVAVSRRYDNKVSLETFRELVKQNMVSGYSLDESGNLVGKDLSEYQSSPFYKHGDIEGFILAGKLSSVEEVRKALIAGKEENDKDTIDLRFSWGDHITIVCDQCGARYSTKNIGRIGARSLFGSECSCPFDRLRVMTDKEFEQYLIGNEIEVEGKVLEDAKVSEARQFLRGGL